MKSVCQTNFDRWRGLEGVLSCMCVSPANEQSSSFSDIHISIDYQFCSIKISVNKKACRSSLLGNLTSTIMLGDV